MNSRLIILALIVVAAAIGAVLFLTSDGIVLRDSSDISTSQQMIKSHTTDIDKNIEYQKEQSSENSSFFRQVETPTNNNAAAFYQAIEELRLLAENTQQQFYRKAIPLMEKIGELVTIGNPTNDERIQHLIKLFSSQAESPKFRGSLLLSALKTNPIVRAQVLAQLPYVDGEEAVDLELRRGLSLGLGWGASDQPGFKLSLMDILQTQTMPDFDFFPVEMTNFPEPDVREKSFATALYDKDPWTSCIAVVVLGVGFSIDSKVENIFRQILNEAGGRRTIVQQTVVEVLSQINSLRSLRLLQEILQTGERNLSSGLRTVVLAKVANRIPTTDTITTLGKTATEEWRRSFERASAIVELGNLGKTMEPKSPDFYYAVNLLLQLADQPPKESDNFTVHQCAIAALGAFHSPDVVLLLQDLYRRSPYDKIRKASVRSIIDQYEGDGAVQVLDAMYREEPDKANRLIIARAFKFIKTPSAQAYLHNLLDRDPDPELAEVVTQALKEQ